MLIRVGNGPEMRRDNSSVLNALIYVRRRHIIYTYIYIYIHNIRVPCLRSGTSCQQFSTLKIIAEIFSESPVFMKHIFVLVWRLV